MQLAAQIFNYGEAISIRIVSLMVIFIDNFSNYGIMSKAGITIER
jgi:hypothetical protein